LDQIDLRNYWTDQDQNFRVGRAM